MLLWRKEIKMHRKYVTNTVAIYRIFVILLFIASIARGQLQRFVEEPQSESVGVGQTHLLRCSVENLSPVSGPVQWLRDGFGLGSGPRLEGFPRYTIIQEGRGEHHLQIANIQLEDDALFECQVGATERSRGLMSRRAKLTVHVPPDVVSIDGAPRVDVTSGLSTDLVCSALNGKPVPVVTWERAGRRVIDGVSQETIVKEDGKRTDAISRLTILPTKADQGSQLICRVTSPAMRDELTSTVTLRVHYKPDLTMIVSPKDEPIPEFSQLSFQCRVEAYPANVTWRWYIGIELIPDRTSDRLDLRSVSRELHKRKVICEATNSAGSSRKDFALNIAYGPRFLPGVENPSADRGDAVELGCQVDSNPEAAIVWHRMGSADDVLGRGSLLRIPSVKDEHFTTFICTASVQGHKTIRREFRIRMKGPPKIASDSSQSAILGDTGKLECFVEGVPKPNRITWKKNGQELSFNGRSRYRIRNEDDEEGMRSVIEIEEVKVDDFAEYICSAENSYGQDELSIEYSKRDTLALAYLLGAVVGGVVVIIIVVVVIVVVIWKHRKSKDIDSSSSRSSEESRSTRKLNNAGNMILQVEYSTESTVDGWRESLPEDHFPRYTPEYDELKYPTTKDPNYSGLSSEGGGFAVDAFNDYGPRVPHFRSEQFDNLYGTFPRGLANPYTPERIDATYGPLYGSETYGRPRRGAFVPVTPGLHFQPPPPASASPTESRFSTNV